VICTHRGNCKKNNHLKVERDAPAWGGGNTEEALRKQIASNHATQRLQSQADLLKFSGNPLFRPLEEGEKRGIPKDNFYFLSSRSGRTASVCDGDDLLEETPAAETDPRR